MAGVARQNRRTRNGYVKSTPISPTADSDFTETFTVQTEPRCLAFRSRSALKMLRRQFHGFSEHKLMDCRTLLRRDA